MSSNTNPQATELTIRDLGGMGDGIAEHRGQTVFVPYTCAGENVLAEITRAEKGVLRARLLEVVEPSPQRQAPPCPVFTQCGGCTLQQLAPQAYGEFKQQTLKRLLHALGVDESILRPLMTVGAESRRRVEFKLQVNKGAVALGFFAPHSHQLVSISHCPVAVPAINALIAPLTALLESLKKPGVLRSLYLTALDEGVDISLQLGSALHPADKEALITFAKEQPILRIHGGDALIYDTGRARIRFGEVEVALPAGSFLQASAKGQQAITGAVLKHLVDCHKVADIYSGCGTYSFPLLKTAQAVTAFEGSNEQIAALHNAILRHGLESKMQAHCRDLVKSPLRAEELKPYDGVVINPPRNGALPQVQEIAKSGIRHVLMVSCNPATFQRDAAHLLQHGYTLQMLQGIDQFTWSSHLEVVAAFTR